VGQIRALIARENERGVPSRRIVLAGFSQGGVMALLAGLGHPEPLAGIVALSCYVVRHGSLEEEEETPRTNRAMPIFQAHGTDDQLIPLRYGLEARDHLRSLGCEVTWRTYPAGHEVHPEEIRDIGSWLGRHLTGAVSDEAQGP
jgi:phospholipase/carboxylesterase